MEKLNEKQFEKLSNYEQKLILGGESSSTCKSNTYIVSGSMYTEHTDNKYETWSDMNSLISVCVHSIALNQK